MLKILVIFFIIFYLLFKVGGVFFRTLLGYNQRSVFNNGKGQYKQKQPKDGNVHVDYNPNNEGEIKGGEYVDYEEVK